MARKTRQSKLSAFKSRYRPSAKALAKKRSQTPPKSTSFKRDYDRKALPPGWRCVNHRDGSKTWYYETRHNRSDVPGRRRRK